MAQSWEGKHSPKNIPEYIGEFNINHIILRNVEILKKNSFQTNIFKKIKI
jgi:hypothetical protein